MLNTSQKLTIAKAVEIVSTQYIHDVAAHDWYHIERVWKMAQKLCRSEKVNQFIVELAALLHDVDDFKFVKGDKNEYVRTKLILKELKIDNDQQSQILEIVKNVSYLGEGVVTTQKTLEGKIVQDADRLDAIGAIAIARCFAYNGRKGKPIYDPRLKPKKHADFRSYKKGSTTAINHFYEKLLLIKDRLNTPQAKRLALRRHEFMGTFLREFFRELEESQS